MTGRVKVMAVLVACPHRIDELRTLLLGMTAPSRAEPGNLSWNVWQDPAVPDRLVLDELYVDAEAVEAHRASPHYRDYLARINGLADRFPLQLVPLDVVG